MKSRLKITSTMLLIALMVSLIPALAMPSSASAAVCDQAQFVSDVTVPDGAKYEPGATFKKTWRIKNIGTCTWTTSYSLVFDSGEQMGAPASIKFPSEIKPGQTIDINVDMTAPTKAGHYRGYWKFKNASGVLFGIGAAANKAWWVDINVTGSDPGGSVVYDFTASAKDATWSSGAGGLTFPGKDGDAKGFALSKDKPKFESGVELAKPGLLFVPQNITNGFIQAEYPAYKVDPGDYFQTTLGCESGATSCYVAYRLDYKIGNTIKTFWTFRERYEGLTYNANISLAPLSGKEVKFILYISSYGSPTGDRALWGNPIISRKGIVPPPPTATGTPSTATPSKTPAPITATVPPSTCDKVQFVADVNFPDGTVVQPGGQFTKTWRMKNVGSCAWSTSYQLVFFSGEKMGGASSAAFTKNVAIGETVEISVNLTAPTAPGSYRGYWMFKNASGALFGIGAQANKPWWVDIKVTGGATATPGPATATATSTAATSTPGGPTATPSATPTSLANTAYDFLANACAASWHSGAGAAALPCPGTNNDAKGFVLKLPNPNTESVSNDPRGGLLTFPQNVQDGYIQGFYPAFKVQNGDRFQSTIGCESGATSCYVVFRLDYQTGTDPIKTFWGPFLERYEGSMFNLDVDLSPLAGKDVKFILTVLAAGSPSGDRALWVGPRVYRGTTTSAPTGNTANDTSTATDWQKYFSEKYGFEVKYPNGSSLSDQTDVHTRIGLPIVTAGTNLGEKYVDITVTENAATCKSPDTGGEVSATENVTINNIQFLKETGAGVGAGNLYEFVAYSSVANNNCVSLTFVLHSTNPGNYETPPPVFDTASESAIFDSIIKTFDWTG
ncbi:MAG: hypothetical protein IPP66_00700 [Anaerolineales bacterium]|nr:hypothetical protein [Anaerolineales bacterium]